jgi:hypothetical protein
MLIDLSEKTYGCIISGLADDHGRIALNIVFDNLDDYLDDCHKWLDQSMSDENIKLRENHSDDDDNLIAAKICTEYSGYIRLSRNLGTYCG